MGRLTGPFSFIQNPSWVAPSYKRPCARIIIPELPGGTGVLLFKYPVEIGEVVKSAFERDLCNVHGGVDQQP